MCVHPAELLAKGTVRSPADTGWVDDLVIALEGERRIKGQKAPKIPPKYGLLAEQPVSSKEFAAAFIDDLPDLREVVSPRGTPSNHSTNAAKWLREWRDSGETRAGYRCVSQSRHGTEKFSFIAATEPEPATVPEQTAGGETSGTDATAHPARAASAHDVPLSVPASHLPVLMLVPDEDERDLPGPGEGPGWGGYDDD